ncbi:leucyl/phenylalanyl-tRNA--protein transferase [Microlunatus sp. Y2014]|uniref:leucyl/phenylalanyl-tRNA--protein transferase n=1 Tax=Microlunatus sp. Y2014 TaxID=3418488 RepID=UPI003DA74A54
MTSLIFGDPVAWPDHDVVGISTEFSIGMVVEAYAHGVFPMPVEVHGSPEMAWFSPRRRGVLPLHGLRVTRSLRKMVKRYRVTADTAFDRVVAKCADPDREGAWINERIATLYGQLHQRGLAHSVECWDGDDNLVGGLYGVGLGGLFAGESMFHDPERGRDASKVALVRLVDFLNGAGGERLLDVQWRTDHLATLGVIEIDRYDYLDRLRQVLPTPAPSWASMPESWSI